MGKGCFIKFIIILTIIIAVIVYIVQNKLNEFVLSPGKKIIKQAFNESWQEEVSFIKPSAEKDSLEKIVSLFIDHLDEVDLSRKHLKKIEAVMENALADSLIDDKELNNLKTVFRVEHEGSKKD